MPLSKETADTVKAISSAIAAAAIVGALLWSLIEIGARSEMGHDVSENHELMEQNKGAIDTNSIRISATEKHLESIRKDVDKIEDHAQEIKVIESQHEEILRMLRERK